jgi:hypothetical protein
MGKSSWRLKKWNELGPALSTNGGKEQKKKTTQSHHRKKCRSANNLTFDKTIMNFRRFKSVRRSNGRRRTTQENISRRFCPPANPTEKEK